MDCNNDTFPKWSQGIARTSTGCSCNTEEGLQLTRLSLWKPPAWACSLHVECTKDAISIGLHLAVTSGKEDYGNLKVSYQRCWGCHGYVNLTWVLNLLVESVRLWLLIEVESQMTKAQKVLVRSSNYNHIWCDMGLRVHEIASFQFESGFKKTWFEIWRLILHLKMLHFWSVMSRRLRTGKEEQKQTQSVISLSVREYESAYFLGMWFIFVIYGHVKPIETFLWLFEMERIRTLRCICVSFYRKKAC